MEVIQVAEVGEPQNKNDDVNVEKSPKAKNEEPEVQNHKKSKEDKPKKKDDKSIEQVLKALSTLGTSEEKLAAMCKKYTDILEENRKMQLQFKQTEKRFIALQKEKDQLQTEQSKAVLTRSRLENLCRELQKQNKAIKEESLLKIREEEEKRKVVSAKFQTALSEVTALMQQNNENNLKLKDENLEMQNKFKTLCEQYELREQKVEKMSKQMQLESQLSEMKLAKMKIDMYAEKELLANEKEQLLLELSACQSKCQEMQKTEAALREQITMYNEKYDEFQSALAKSNQIYSGFKCEMEKMSKKIGKLEKETSVWKMKWEGSHKALLQMAAEKQQRDADLALTTRKLNQLQKLCRAFQAERSSLILQLKNAGQTPSLDDNLQENNESTTEEKLTTDLPHDSSGVISNETSDAGLDECTVNPKILFSSGIKNNLGEENISLTEGENKDLHDQCHTKNNAETNESSLISDKDISEKNEAVINNFSVPKQSSEELTLKTNHSSNGSNDHETEDSSRTICSEDGKKGQINVKSNNVNKSTKKAKDGGRRKKK